MSIPATRRRAARLIPAILWFFPACVHDQLQTARVFSQDHNVVVIAIPEDKPWLRDRADKLARSKLGKDAIFVKVGEITTDDIVKTGYEKRKILRPNDKVDQENHRREYHVTYKAKRTTTD